MGQSLERKRDDLEVIIRYVQRKERHLTETQLDVLNKVNFADDVLRRHGPGEATYNMVAERFDISVRQARRYCDNAEYVYGSQPRLKKEYWRRAVFERLYSSFTELAAEFDADAKKEGDDRRIDLDKLTALTRMAAEIRKTVGYDKEDMETPPASSEITQVIIGADPTIIGAEFIDRKVLDETLARVTKLASDAAIDVDHEEL